MSFLKLFFFFLFTITIYAKPLVIDGKTNFYDLLPSAQIYIDKTRSLRLEDIKKKDAEFKNNDKKLLGYGYSPDFDVWVKFTLKNSTNKPLDKILEYDNTLTSSIDFYSPDNNNVPITKGLHFITSKRKTINPFFIINLKPQEEKVYYFKTSSYITPLIIKLNILNKSDYYAQEITHQIVLALFFGAMLVLMLYNLFIFFFTKDISYLFYVFYITGIIIHHTLYVGVAQIHLLNQDGINLSFTYASLIVAFPPYALALFSRTFLLTKQYPIMNKILNFYLIAIPISLIIFITTDLFHQYRNIFFISLLLYLLVLTIYAAFKRNRQAYFVLFGWLAILLAFAFMYLSSAGIFNIYEFFPYIVEVALVLEAIIFSIALADRINHLQKDKEDANKNLILQQKNEQKMLELKVKEKTQDLEVALDEKGLLLKELNHRVKNNMQMIVSLIRLQSDEIEDERLQDIFTTAQNRINAMSHLHELLYKQDNISHINAYEYFGLLIEEIKESYENNININFNINSNLKMEQAIYCGLILNELISNSLKYAFPNGGGNIHVNLNKNDTEFHLCINDDGIGYDNNGSSNSLGLILVDTLATKQLRGDIQINSSNGVEVNITWRSNE